MLVLGFEPCLDAGDIIDSRRGNRWYELKIKGREAHAGRAHKEGVNACWELSKKLDALSQLTNYDKDLTVSIGHIEGGKDKFNVVCGQASAKIDVRFSSLKIRDQFHKNFEDIVRKNSVFSVLDQKEPEVSYEIIDDTPPMSSTPKAMKWIEILKMKILKYEKRKIISKKSGGAADSNYFNRPGLPIIDGLGACGGKMHTPEEYIELSTLETRSNVLADFLETF